MTALSEQLASAPFFPIKARNQWVDSVFYDVDVLTPEEKACFSRLIDREATVIVVPPSYQEDRKILHYSSGLRFVNHEAHDITALVVAGVGSSVLGSAALARAVANAIGRPVAAIVSGYGMLDVVTEGLGGWFFYGMMDRVKYQIKEGLTRSVSNTMDMPAFHNNGSGKRSLLDSAQQYLALSGWTDAGTLLDILMARPEKLNLLVGHSKGCLIIDYVLTKLAEELVAADRTGIPVAGFFQNDINIVTLGAVVSPATDLPSRFKYHQFLGEMDLLGRLNSNSSAPHEILRGTGHHLNAKSNAVLGSRNVDVETILQPFK